MAGGNILPYSFVKIDTSANEQVLQCGVGDTPVGITGTWTRYAAGTGADDGFESVLGEQQGAVTVGGIVPLQCGTLGTWTAGVFLKPDSLGYGTPATSSADITGAYALESAVPGQVSRVIALSTGQGAPGASASVVVLTANTTLTAANSGQLIVVSAADKTITTPTGVAGLKYKVMAIGNASTAGSVGTTLHVPTGDDLVRHRPERQRCNQPRMGPRSLIGAGAAFDVAAG